MTRRVIYVINGLVEKLLAEDGGYQTFPMQPLVGKRMALKVFGNLFAVVQNKNPPIS